jgi:hypothetical protein
MSSLESSCLLACSMIPRRATPPCLPVLTLPCHRYVDLGTMAMDHNTLAGNSDCDHMHDGLGFLTNHGAQTVQFEQALQAVNPRVSVPYWDYTIGKACTIGRLVALSYPPPLACFTCIETGADTVCSGGCRWSHCRALRRRPDCDNHRPQFFLNYESRAPSSSPHLLGRWS